MMDCIGKTSQVTEYYNWLLNIHVNYNNHSTITFHMKATLVLITFKIRVSQGIERAKQRQVLVFWVISYCSLKCFIMISIKKLRFRLKSDIRINSSRRILTSKWLRYGNERKLPKIINIICRSSSKTVFLYWCAIVCETLHISGHRWAGRQ